jgi:tRNA G10  N-methylase Trm11
VKILDMSAGKRNIWFQRLYPDTVFIDKRPEMFPDVVADSHHLPFPDGLFDLIVFDPPHMVHGESSMMAKYYGSLSGTEIKDLIHQSSLEAYRVSTPQAMLSFKWNDHDVRLDHTLPLMEGWEPLFGHNFKAGRRSETYWVLCRKRISSYGNERILRLDVEK